MLNLIFKDYILTNKILVTGGNGQLAQCIKLCASNNNNQFFFADIDILDINDNIQLENFVKENEINVIVNCAAYTAVDLAETHVEKAFEANHFAIKNVVEVCNTYNVFLIHLSTDYVFDGNANLPYDELAIPNPQSIYGKSKLKGEKEIINHSNASIIIRTSWLYSQFGNNFVKTIRQRAKTLGKLKVVNDQFGNPTYAYDLAEFILYCIDQKKSFQSLENNIFHFSNTGNISWYDFAVQICKYSYIECEIEAVDALHFPTVAVRPKFSVFNTDKVEFILNYPIKNWQERLLHCIQILENSN